jgi:hypothetical protein
MCVYMNNDSICPNKLTKKHKLLFTIFITNHKLNYYYLYWNLQPESQMKKYVCIKSNMYFIDSIGGGFASIKNSDMAYYYLVLLYKFASIINDKEVMIKCMIYYGHTLLWKNEIKKAYIIINKQKKVALKYNYQNLVFRCESLLQKN